MDRGMTCGVQPSSTVIEIFERFATFVLVQQGQGREFDWIVKARDDQGQKLVQRALDKSDKFSTSRTSIHLALTTSSPT